MERLAQTVARVELMEEEEVLHLIVVDVEPMAQGVLFALFGRATHDLFHQPIQETYK
jgi:hypothetical protein